MITAEKEARSCDNNNTLTPVELDALHQASVNMADLTFVKSAYHAGATFSAVPHSEIANWKSGCN